MTYMHATIIALALYGALLALGRWAFPKGRTL